MAASRYLLQHFALANPLYINATVTAYTVSGGVKTATKATLYADETSATTLQNPQALDSTGKFSVPIYIAVPVVLTIDGFGNVPEHDTGIIQGSIALFSSYSDAASASQTAAASSATAAAASATSASSSASAASSSAASAAVSASNLNATSTTSLLIAAASKTFVTQSGKQFAAGQFLLASSAADPANYMHGQVTSYSGTSLVVNMTNVGGSGTLADWNLSVSGSRGAAGTSSAGGSNGQIQVNSSGSLAGVNTTGTGDVVLASAIASLGTVTSVATNNGITGGPITTSGTIGLANIGDSSLLGNISGVSAVPVQIGLSSFMDYSFGSTQGSILYRGGSSWSLLTPGTSGKFLKTQGASANPMWDTPATAGVIDTQTFNNSGTWTKPSGGGTYATVIIECWGGGGSGGGSGGGGGLGYGGGGGGGGYTYRLIPLSSLGSTESVTIGAGGILSGTANGTAGGTTSFGSWMSAPGGSGGSWAASSGTASGGAGGSYDLAGGNGGSTTASSSSSGGFSNHGGGGGGGGYNGSGGTSKCGGNGGAAHENGSAPGGGGGGYSAATGTSGNGAAGKVIVTVFG